MNSDHIISNHSVRNFTEKALEVFRHQAEKNPVYKEYLQRINCDIAAINTLEKIPFLPISFFKTHQVLCDNNVVTHTFLSSGTTGETRSKHLISDIERYKMSFRKGFQYFFDNIREYTILALLPSYLEQQNSSLVYMIRDLIIQSGKKDSGFYLNDYQALIKKLHKLDSNGEKVLLIGVSYALLDLIKLHTFKLSNTIIMETGGMKGRRKELTKGELHELLTTGFGVSKIYSEYGMTELLSQAYSKGDGLFKTPPWMKILIREIEDPFTMLPVGKSGGINVIDLANVNSCSFIATQDLGKIHTDGSFEVLGRYDHSDIRGCNLML